MSTSVVWFKNDLRLHDNETLVKAIKHSTTIIPVYCIDKRLFEATPFGFKKISFFRLKFLFEALNDLHNELQKTGSGLLVVYGIPEEEIPKIVLRYKAEKIYTKKEVAYEELLTLGKVEKEVWKHHCTVETYSTSTLYVATDLPFALKDIPDVFTKFRSKVEHEVSVRPTFDKPSAIPSPELPAFSLPDFSQCGITEIHPDKRTAFPFMGGESQALKRIHYYFYDTRLISNYKETRNGMVGSDYSSKLSPWLALGCLSPREVYHEIKNYESIHGSNASTYWLYFELLWRDFFRFMMKKHHSNYFKKNGIGSSDTKVFNPDNTKLTTWVNGKTGNDFIDANMLELKQTGFISNRGRQNVASYLCNDLKIDWRYGAAYFEQQLIDYDVCSNWGNWAYIAGVGNDPRKDRYFNIELQAKNYDPKKEYRALWLA